MTTIAPIVFETNDIIRLHLEFDIIKTCVFLVKNANGYTMIDCGVNEITTKQQLLPALKRLQIPMESIKHLLLSHAHGDHVGGLPFLLPSLPNVKVFACQKWTDATSFLKDGLQIEALQAVHLPGHTLDSYGFLDLRTDSLISGDAIQLWGIGDFGVNAESPEKYLESHQKLLKMPIENIFSSHYYDFLGIRAIGAAASAHYIKESEKNFRTLMEFVKKNAKATKDAEAAKETVALCQMFESEHQNYPKMQPCAIEQIIKYLQI